MEWTLNYKSGVKKDFSRISYLESLKIISSLNSFIENFSEEQEKILLQKETIKKLKGDMEGCYRLRLRTYRVIYKKNLNELIILVVRLGHRRDIFE